MARWMEMPAHVENVTRRATLNGVGHVHERRGASTGVEDAPRCRRPSTSNRSLHVSL
jgi:hypothetical protein